ncbi:MAG: hypothetical protein M3R69_18825 [Acidobacteriota bacterium]|jgi:hypothetical protein|nr:hypothetical protein [Acidobacteriota bacterium]
MDASTATTARKAARVSLSVNPHNQNLETVHKIVEFILSRGGCDKCGRLAFLDLHFLGDPGPDLTKIGGISLEIQER